MKPLADEQPKLDRVRNLEHVAGPTVSLVGASGVEFRSGGDCHPLERGGCPVRVSRGSGGWRGNALLSAEFEILRTSPVHGRKVLGDLVDDLELQI